jgi:hypothetical protein
MANGNMSVVASIKTQIIKVFLWILPTIRPVAAIIIGVAKNHQSGLFSELISCTHEIIKYSIKIAIKTRSMYLCLLIDRLTDLLMPVIMCFRKYGYVKPVTIKVNANPEPFPLYFVVAKKNPTIPMNNMIKAEILSMVNDGFLIISQYLPAISPASVWKHVGRMVGRVPLSIRRQRLQ